MRQKFNVTIADIPMNISCEETEESISRAVTALDGQMRELLTSSGSNCTKTEAALLLALDYCTRAAHAEEKAAELEAYVSKGDPNLDNFGASLLRGENEALRAELQVGLGNHDALLQDNAVLYRMHQKSEKQCAASNARADRMHDQVLALMTEVQTLRAKLEEVGIPTGAALQTRDVPPAVPAAELTEEEQEVRTRYEQMNTEELAKNAPALWAKGAEQQ